ncbi:hypothetical protein A3Q56_02325 [Intoshia linei]|uniref:Apextrin C-terminal domain-containing protein n=1 Tax=Intoshia linei TaxID=1819745 RepID=A0A177B8D0_9BILA|nr:hypothetical protein A3Q56_02325 [Intoshia linei]
MIITARITVEACRQNYWWTAITCISHIRPKEGCPKGYWDIGRVVYGSDNNVTTASETLIHFDENTYSNGFCTQRINKDLKPTSFPSGSYCVFQHYKCPPKLTASSFTWKRINQKKYIEPIPFRGNETFSSINFCCGNDVDGGDIALPIDKPFYLIKFASHCQKVYGLSHNEEKITYTFKAMHIIIDGGLPPSHKIINVDGSTHIEIQFCYYQKKFDKTFDSNMFSIILCVTVLCFSIFSLIFTAFIMRKKDLKKTQKCKKINDATNRNTLKFNLKL